MRKLIRISLFSILFILSVSTASSQACDYIYVSLSGNIGGNGTDTMPVPSLSEAMTLVTPTRKHIRIEQGYYYESAVINMSNDLTIEGGYLWWVGPGWFKTPSVTTTIEFSGEYTVPGYNLTSRIGFNAHEVNNWALMDLNIITTDIAGQDLNGRGKSNYAVRINNCNGYTISRCKIWAGNAGDGVDGVIGDDGEDNWFALGWEGGCPAINLTYECLYGVDTGGEGGQGGQGTGPSPPAGGLGGYNAPGPNHGSAGVPANGIHGGSGGGGGAGQDECQTTPGDPSYQAGWGGPGFTCNNTEVLGGPGPDHNPFWFVQGVNGTDGPPGDNGMDGANALTGTYDWFYYPGNGGDGTNGCGGAGGGGGSGSTARHVYNAWVGPLLAMLGTEAGLGGGGGGGGGGGAFGGTGGKGGGGSFGIYSFNSTGSIVNDSITTENGGQGGVGKVGGQGGDGGPGGYPGGSGGGFGFGCGGTQLPGGYGGNGGAGGNGGKGGDGADGPSYQLTINGVGSLSMAIIPKPPIKIFSQGCTNTPITIIKTPGSGNWNLPVGASFVCNLTPTTTAYDLSSDTAQIVYFNLGWDNLTHNGSIMYNYVYNGTNRPLPTFAPSIADTMCADTVILSSTTTGTEYYWNVYADGSTAANPIDWWTSPSATWIATPGVYWIQLKVKNDCCGWSVPVYKKIVIGDFEAPTFNTINNITQNTDVGQCSAVVTWSTPSTNDNCVMGTVVCSPPSGSVFPHGTTTVNVTATDIASNSSTTNFTVTVIDNEPPVINSSSNMVACASDTILFSYPTFTDNCNGYVTQISGLSSGQLFPVGTNTVSFVAIDSSGNMSLDTTSFTILINDNPTPTFINGDHIMCTTYSSEILAGYPVGGTFSGPGVTGSNFDPSIAGIGYHFLYYTYTDANLCSGTDSIIVAVFDCAGIESLVHQTVRVYPVPASDFVVIEMANDAFTSVQLIDMTGKIVLQKEFEQGNKMVLDLAAIANGIYSIKLTDKNGQSAHKIVVAH